MRKTLLILSSVFASSCLLAQEPADALRFSWTVPGGTARQQAIGGAMGSLGGDMSATFVNPAGLAFYRTGDLAFTPQFRFGNNKATYFNRTEKESGSKFNFGTTGFVAGSGSNSNNNIKNVAISFAYNRSADFNSNILYRGANNESSYAARFVEELNNSGRRDSTVTYEFPLGSSLAFNAYWIDPVYDGAGKVTGFQTKFPAGTTLLQQDSVVNRGGINEYALGFGVNTNDKLMLGGTIGIPVLNYQREATFVEADPTNDQNNGFDFGSFTEKLSTKGVGANLKLGVIFKPQEFWRIGLAFHTPTVYSLTDNYEASVTANTEGFGDPSQHTLTDYSLDYTNNAPYQSKYLLFTPYRAIVSASYVLREIEDVTRQRGFLTADVEYVNYKASSYEPADDFMLEEDKAYLQSLNLAIDNAYKGAFNFKVGGELKFTTIMVRAGANYFGNPYKNIRGEKGHKMNLSAGLGYRNKGRFIDLTYVHALNKDVRYPYRLQYAPYSGAQIKSSGGNVMMTFGFKF